MSAVTGTTTATPEVAADKKLRHGALSIIETFGQSIAVIAPTLTPALNITVVAATAGVACWLSYFVGTIGVMIVALSVGILASRHAQAGAFFVYIGRSFGPYIGALAGWSMISAYIMTAIAVVEAFPIFVGNLLTAVGITKPLVPLWAFGLAQLGMICYAAYRDIKFSSRAGLICECISVGIIIVITCMVIGVHGTVIDPQQLAFSKFNYGSVFAGLPFVIFSFVGFESSATLAKESGNPKRNIPIAVVSCAAFAGVFFTAIAYFMMFGDGDNAAGMGASSSPFTDVAGKAGLSWTASIVYFAACISSFACGLACINAGSRLLYSMGRYQFLHGSMGLTHKKHQTPHLAVFLSVGIVLVAYLALLPAGFLNAFGWTGTIAAFGFVIVYLAMCIAAPVEMKKTGDMKRINVLIGAVGVALMLFVIWGSVYPVPSYPFNILPYLFLGYMVAGAIWFFVLKSKSPQVLASIVHDMEG
jgi:amino acid transporter